MSNLKVARRVALLSVLACGGAALGASPISGLDLPGFDTGVRAQDDLFRHVNGAWFDKTSLPADKPEYGTLAEVQDETDRQLRAIVEELSAKPQKPGSAEQKIATLYRAYTDTDTIDRAGLKPAKAMLDAIAAIKTRADLARWLGQAQGQVDTPIQLSVKPDPKDPGVYLALTWQGGLGMPDRDYYLKDDDRLVKARAAYSEYLTRLAGLAGDQTPQETARQVLKLEERIAEAHWSRVETHDPVKTYNPMTTDALATMAPGFDWTAFVAAAGLSAIDRLSVSQPSTATAIAGLMGEVDLAQWRRYLTLRVLDTYAEVLPKSFREASFAFRGTALDGTTEDKPRWQKGIDEVNVALGEAVGQIYVARHFPPEHKARMAALVVNLMAAYGSSIDGLGWMTPATKAAAKDKLAKCTIKIGYPDKWRDYSALVAREDDAFGNRVRSVRFEWQRIAARAGKPVDRAEWSLTPQTVNAKYDPSLNEMTFPAAILQPPSFNATADDAVNYGAIGAVIGHEISHGFDNQGSQYDGVGRLRNWWTDADRKAFEALGAELVAQFAQYEPLPGMKLDGKLTLDENIADLSGLQIAYKAYLRSLGGKAAPVVDGYTGPQRFFLGWAQFFRDKVRDELALQLLSVDNHAPGRFRTNGAVVNHDGFHEAFGTRPGDALYKPTTERIRIW